jgi:competence protein ComEC
MDATMELLVWLAALPASVWQQHAPASWTIVAAVVGIFWLLLPRGFPARWLGLIALLPLFLVVPPAPRHGDAHIAVLDVGQGLAVVVRTAKHALLYDAGPLYSPDVDSGSRIVVPYLRATGIRRLDGLIVSHADNDHAGGVSSVLAAVPVVWMASSLPASSTQHQSVPRSVPCFAGQRWHWDGVEFEILHPAYETYAIERMKANDRSCVLKITAAGQRVLLTGDVEARSERAMLARNAQSLRADVLVAPHHGSSTSSTESFVAAVSPQMAIFTVGYRNRFGHPRTEVVGRYARSWVLRSDWHGALLIDIGVQGIELELQRERRRRYWHDPPSGTGPNFDEH